MTENREFILRTLKIRLTLIGLERILSDTSKFKKIDPTSASGKDITISREQRLQRYLNSLKGNFSKEVYTSIYPNGSIPSKLYGLPKIHKVTPDIPLPPFRPIVSSIGAYNHKLAKHLANLLQPFVPCTYSVKDTFSFVSDIKKVKAEHFLVSFDVTSLFTNVPLEESIRLAVDKLLENDATKIKRVELLKLF